MPCHHNPISHIQQDGRVKTEKHEDIKGEKLIQKNSYSVITDLCIIVTSGKLFPYYNHCAFPSLFDETSFPNTVLTCPN